MCVRASVARPLSRGSRKPHVCSHATVSSPAPALCALPRRPVVMWNRVDRALCASHMRGEATAGARTEGISVGIPGSSCYTPVDALAHASAASCA